MSKLKELEKDIELIRDGTTPMTQRARDARLEELLVHSYTVGSGELNRVLRIVTTEEAIPATIMTKHELEDAVRNAAEKTSIINDYILKRNPMGE